MRVTLIVGLLLISGTLGAEVYKWTDADGNIVYSDVPHPDAEIINADGVQVYKAPKLPFGVLTRKPKTKSIAYKSVRVVSPANDETFRDDGGDIAASVALTPSLQTSRGHRLVLLMDGQPQGSPSARTTFRLSNVVRGSHTLVVQVIDKDGQAVSSSPGVTFQLHRTVKKKASP